jgi:copper chaperone NosL
MSRLIARMAQCGLHVLVLFAAACNSGGEPKPPQIAYGRDMCDQCGMTIDDERFASALVMQDGKTLKFDDSGEMFAYQAQHPAEVVRAWFVHDYTTKAWIGGEKATYVISDQVRSPMGTGVAAFAERAAAETFARQMNGKVLSFDEARAALKARM